MLLSEDPSDVHTELGSGNPVAAARLEENASKILAFKGAYTHRQRAKGGQVVARAINGSRKKKKEAGSALSSCKWELTGLSFETGKQLDDPNGYFSVG